MSGLTIFSLVAAAVVLSFLWRWFTGRNQPKYAPLEIADDDPAMLAAIEKARTSLDRFRELLAAGLKEAQVKVRFAANSGEVEHLWAEVLELTDTTVTVRYLTPPVTHTGIVERVHEHPVADIEDWAAITHQSKIHGGYTQRVMFEKARELWGHLPPELEDQESRYVA